MVTFLVALAVVILFGTGDWLPSGQACLGSYYWVDSAQCAFVLLPSVIFSAGPSVLLHRVLGRAVEIHLCVAVLAPCASSCACLSYPRMPSTW